jgi:nitrite reductase/ring-hydroxylating ferredoxin subunit
LNENLIAFRATSGKVGLVDDACPHRGASMFFGRNEEEGLRCVYHGWKFDTTGQCTDMMNEPAESNFKNKVRITAYPTRERGGIIWAYMGPRENPPPLPDLEANMVVEGTPRVNSTLNYYNWLQAMENNMDTSHNPILHYGAVTPESLLTEPQGYEDNKYMVAQRAPDFRVQDAPYGCTYTCFRVTEDDQHYHRTMHWLFPFFTMSPVPKLGSQAVFVATIPIDDYHNMQWSMSRTVGEGVQRFGDPGAQRGNLPNTTDWLGRFRNSSDPSTDFGLDRDLQSSKKPILQGWTGLPSVNMQDEAMKWGQGRANDYGIVRRDLEHLGTTDAMIIRVRRKLLEAAKALHEHGTPPPCLETPEVYRLRSGWIKLPKNVEWYEATRELREAFRGEVAEASPAS